MGYHPDTKSVSLIMMRLNTFAVQLMIVRNIINGGKWKQDSGGRNRI